MPLFGPKKKKVLVAEEHTGPMERKVYDYIDTDVHVSAHEREVEGREVPVRDYTQRREVREPERKPSFLGLRRKKDRPRSFMEKGGDAASDHADMLEK